MSMERKVCVYIATSLDGYIATKDDSLEWLFKIEGEGDNGYAEFYNSIDTILIGRRTYDWVMEFENGNFPYKNKECYVFSKNLKGNNGVVEFVDEDIASFVEKLKNEQGKNIWVVGGGELLHHFLKEKLVDEFIITIAPTLIGKGIPLYKEADYEMDLILKEMRQYGQFAQMHYVVK